MHPAHRVARLLRLALPMAGFCVFNASAADDPLPRFASHVRTPIDCATTPFGNQVTLGYDMEAINLLSSGSGFNGIDEYQPAPSQDPPLVRSFRQGLYPGALAGSTFLKAVSIDLNGDGRDEVVSANRIGASGNLQLGVFERTAAPGVQLLDSWTVTASFNDVSLVVGDFDGSLDGRQELGVLLKTTNGGARVYVLTGTASGGIAEADGASSGYWNRPGPVGSLDIAAGDMLLDGRAQLVVVNEASFGQSRRLDYHLLEYQPTTSALPVAAGDIAIGSRSFQSPMGETYQHDNGGATVDQIRRIEADAGDIVDGAAAELVVHTQFRGGSVEYIGRRLHHFTVERDLGTILDIGFANRNGPGESGYEYDSSRLVDGASETAPVSFEVTVADIDRRAPSEMVLVRAEYDNKLVVEGYKADIDLVAGYTYAASANVVQFINTSTGTLETSSWTFGDGDTSSERSPMHQYDNPGTYTVTLTVTDAGNTQRSVAYAVAVGGSSAGGSSPGYMYHLEAAPAYRGVRLVDSAQDLQFVNVAAGDMDRDGLFELMTLARDTSDDILRSVWRVTWPANPADPPFLSGAHVLETSDDFNSMTAMDLLASDFDGDSIKASIGSDCRQVQEPQLRQVVWMPPYFQRLQETVGKEALFGDVIGGGESSETRFGSYTSHDISAYLGISIGSDLLGVDASVRATAGYNYQTRNGQIHGTENSFEINQGFSQDDGDALVVYEENSFNCYSYELHTADGGPAEQSGARLCEILDDSRQMRATHARAWDRQIPALPLDHPPAQWIPLQRDWASLALFRGVASNAPMQPDGGADRLTDGWFDTAAESSGATQQPYLQIDLGQVRDISNIRVFPLAGEVAALQGFQLYASATPMNGDAIPGGGNVHVYAPETADGAGLDRWNVWTRARTSPYTMLKARYIRLQHPSIASLHVAEIQVFGDVHVEPPMYPAAVCDPDEHDQTFLAKVWDASGNSFRNIQVRGDLLWSGAQNVTMDCTNEGVNLANILSNVAIGDDASVSWQMGTLGTTLIGQDTGFESSTRVGAEFDIEAGFIATVQAGGAYEYTSGITEDVQSMTYWGTGLEMGGAIGGFDTDDQALINACLYGARPYAYRLKDRSNVGYQHDMYVVDYIVAQNGQQWQRDNVPLLCLHADAIFADGFD